MEHNPEECFVCICHAADKAMRPYASAYAQALLDQLDALISGEKAEEKEK